MYYFGSGGKEGDQDTVQFLVHRRCLLLPTFVPLCGRTSSSLGLFNGGTNPTYDLVTFQASTSYDCHLRVLLHLTNLEGMQTL